MPGESGPAQTETLESCFLATGGAFDETGECLIWHVDLARETARTFLRWTPPEHLRVSRKGFAGGALGDDGHLYVAAHCAVVRINIERAAVTGVLHLPCFNDLHHVWVDSGRLFVVNTGRGSIDVLSIEGEFLGSHSLLPAWVDARRMDGGDPADWHGMLDVGWEGRRPREWPPLDETDPYYTADRSSLPFHQQKVHDYLHLNHVRLSNGQLLASCLDDGSVRDMYTLRVVAQVPGLYPHDGVPDGDKWCVTGIDGRVLVLDLDTSTIVEELDTFSTGHYGWCRGLHVNPRSVVVGLTEVRRGRLPKHRWSELDPDGSETSVVLLDRQRGDLLARVDLTDAARHSKIFSVLALLK